MQFSRAVAAACFCLAFAGAACAQDATPPDSTPQQGSLMQKVMALHWVEGPTRVDVGDNATFQVPAGYRYLGPADTVKFMELTKNLTSNTDRSVFAPDDFRWFGSFDYADVGHVPDDEKIDADKLLATLRSNQSEANEELKSRGWPTLEIAAWAKPPFYDPDTHNLGWAIELRSSNGGDDINYNTRLLSRTGYTAATLVTDPASLQASTAQFREVVAGYQFKADQAYAAYKPGDKVAKYGLAALITGGAAAVAVKTGFWKVIVGALAAGWKFISVGVLALFAALRKFLGRLGGKRE